ncbi:hypothetical protein J15TS10_47450 [Paenibacillus woosongensis]|uniref:Uncharacterized protein n=1 Tax=Paenibacillus woosongensis TaxID=307580 RepID=A0ABQ4MYF2_9BACL|nr:hypothetical protein J15TS10_47450 [Paenibacillus woosongensis]
MKLTWGRYVNIPYIAMCYYAISTKLCLALNGIHVSNYALSACFIGLDGSYAPKIKNPVHIGYSPSFNDMKST